MVSSETKYVTRINYAHNTSDAEKCIQIYSPAIKCSICKCFKCNRWEIFEI